MAAPWIRHGLENVGAWGILEQSLFNSQTEQSPVTSSGWVMLGPQRSLKASLCDRILRHGAGFFQLQQSISHGLQFILRPQASFIQGDLAQQMDAGVKNMEVQ